MRLPLVPPIESRDGTVDKDCLCKNLLIEQDDDAILATLRPGLLSVGVTTGDGGGVVEFNNRLISVFGDTLFLGTNFVELGTVADGVFDFTQSTL